MSCAYVVRRRSVFHFRIRVPIDLVPALGKREVRMSLGEYGHKQAVLRASSLALHSQSFFTAIRSSMQHFTSAQIAHLVATWRERMRERDEDIRRRIEVGLHPQTLQRYADASDHDADVYGTLLEQLVSSPAVYESELGGPEPRQQDREKAFSAAAESMTNTDDDPDSCYLPIIDAKTLAELDKLSQRDLAKNYLIAASQLASQRARQSYSVTAADVPQKASSLASVDVVPPNAKPIVRGESLQATWDGYLQDQARRSETWRSTVPEKAVLAFRDFVELIGNKPINEVTRQDCNRFLLFQETRPNANVRCYRGVSASELERMAIPSEHKQSSQNAMHKVSEISRFFRWCETEHRINKSPAEDLKVAEGDTYHVQAWSIEEMRELLNAANLREKSGLSDPRSTVSYLPWTIVLGAYTGARLAA